MGLLSKIFGTGQKRPIQLFDRVRIVVAPSDDHSLLNQCGEVQMIVDGATAAVTLDDGQTAVVNLRDLERL